MVFVAVLYLRCHHYNKVCVCVGGGGVYVLKSFPCASRFCLDRKGKARAHIIKNIIFIVSSELLIPLQPNLV